MCDLTVRLFGQYQVQRGAQVLDGPNARRVQEFFAFLLINRTRPFARATLSDLLWPNSSAEQATKYLRQALWQLKSTLGCNVLFVDAEWVGLDSQASLWLDVHEFECAYTQFCTVPGHQLGENDAQILRNALQLYRGDFLEGWYQDWCLFERERLQWMFFDLLAKQMAYCETNGEYHAGLEYGALALRYDAAHERIHRRMMRLYYLTGDRTAALRQYERCVAFLRDQLGVDPARQTIALYEQIKSDFRLEPDGAKSDRREEALQMMPMTSPQTLRRLKQLQMGLVAAQHQLQETIEVVEATLNGKH
jgi:DNA-binding SARP family transcriptional activator